MSARRGVLTAGTWCVDFNKSIPHWPAEDTTNEVVALDRQGGGSGCNMAIDLKRLDPDLPVETMGVVGDDDHATFLLAQCDAYGIERGGLVRLPGAATMSVDAFNVLSSGRRTHFFHPGAAAAMSPEHFNFSRSRARFLHLGLPGAHARMDAPWGGDANGWVTTLREARRSGLVANLELMTIARARVAALARPCLPHLDMLIANEFEIGAVADVETRRTNGPDLAAIAAAVETTLSLGAMTLVVAHFPEGAIVATREGGRYTVGSVAIPDDAIAGANGAGDAFAAGMLYALHEGWEIEAAVRLAHACAAASARAVSTTAGVARAAECLALAEHWGFRPAPA